jgi:hypothetical protein
MGTITTAFPTSFKQELAQAMHCFTAPINFTANTNTNNTLSSMSTQANLCRGMGLSAGGDIPASCFIVDLPTGTTATIFPASTGTHTGNSLTANGDVFNVALIIASPTGNYGAATTSYASLGADEVTGTGYSAGGQALSVNITPQISGTTAFWSWSVNPSWTSATFSTGGCEFYNNSLRAGVVGRVSYVGSFGGTQTVTGGTFTLVLPTNNSSNAILRIQ